MDVMINPRSIVVTKPAREGQLGDVESQAEVGVPRQGCQARTDNQISQEDDLYQKRQTKVRYNGASQALGPKLLGCGLAEGEEAVPPGAPLHQLVQEAAVPLPVGVEHLALSYLVFKSCLQLQLLA